MAYNTCFLITLLVYFNKTHYIRGTTIFYFVHQNKIT